MSYGLLIVDMQEHKDYPGINPLWRHVVDNQIQLIRFCQDKSIPITVVEKRDGPLRETFTELQKELQGAVLIPKYGLDAFEGTFLEERLYGVGVQNVILTGFHSMACVLWTAEGVKLSGRRLATSLDLLAGHQRGYANYEVQAAYKQKGAVYPSTTDLIAAVAREMEVTT